MARNGKVVVVDGASVAYEEQTKDDKPRVSNIVAVRRALEEQGYRPIIMVDASLRHHVDDPNQLERRIPLMIINGQVQLYEEKQAARG